MMIESKRERKGKIRERYRGKEGSCVWMGRKKRDEGLRIPRAVRTTDMITIRTYLPSRREQHRALMTRPPNPLHRLLLHQRLSTSPTRYCQDGSVVPETPIRIRLKSTLNCSLRRDILLLLALRLGLPHRIARTLGAASMLAGSAHLVPSERRLAFVACPVDAHPDWLLDAQGLLLGPGGELVRFDLGQLEAFHEFVGSFRVDLRAHYLHRLWSRGCDLGCWAGFLCWCRCGFGGVCFRCAVVMLMGVNGWERGCMPWSSSRWSGCCNGTSPKYRESF